MRQWFLERLFSAPFEVVLKRPAERSTRVFAVLPSEQISLNSGADEP